MNQKWRLGFVFIILLAMVFAGYALTGQKQARLHGSKEKEIILATTTSTYDTGLLGYLVPAFEKKSGYQVKILAKGTGAALELGKRGDVDVLLVHAKDQELALVKEGFFVDRHDVMYNDFIIVGPVKDPAGIQDYPTAGEGFKAIAEKQVRFISRGDNSGTHMKETAIWQGIGINPTSPWYFSVGQGMGETLGIASEMQGYTLTDRATYLSMQKTLKLAILLQGDPVLFNQYGIMAVNPARHPKVNYQGALQLIQFVTGSHGQALIGEYTKAGSRLFTPNAKPAN
ncbi:MAG: substrate-binding domain-containing protein [Bacillota bacterium]